MAHLSTEILSTYIDRELAGSEIGKVEEHLDECLVCQTRFRGLRRVVDRLSEMESIAPPSYLGPEVRRFVALQRSTESGLTRIEAHAARFKIHSPLIPAFAVVIALIVIIYLLASGISRQVGSRPGVIVAPAPIETLQSLQIGSRVFEKRAERWVEKGWSGAAPLRRIEIDGEEFARFIENEPALADLDSLDAVVWLVMDDEPVEIYRSQP